MDARDAGVILDIPIDRKSLAEVTGEALEAINRRISQRVFVCANSHSLVVAQHDFGFQSALTQANLVVADGVGVTVMAKLAGARSALGLREPITSKVCRTHSSNEVAGASSFLDHRSESLILLPSALQSISIPNTMRHGFSTIRLMERRG